ncbi:hypothetical protein [Bradyrhizobium sp. STM 3557]|uniref:hypothetical protein n=1 Tax=Bradyrhizobium sp. STM 3557 TaxID=578920 RepID=UPI0038901FA2
MSSMSEQNPTNPQDPLHYAPRYLREKPEGARLSLVEDARDAAQSTERPSRAVMPAAKHLDARLEGAVFESLRHSLDPHVMREPPEFARERDRRSVALKIAARFAAATGVAAVVALFFVNIVPVSRQPDASSSFVAAVQSMKTTTPPPAAAPAPAVAPEVKEVKAEQSEAKPDKTDIKSMPALSQFQSLLASGDGAQAPAQAKTETTIDKPLLQQFMQWNQKTMQSDKAQ